MGKLYFTQNLFDDLPVIIYSFSLCILKTITYEI